MITIVLIEDEERDIKHIRNVLVPLKSVVEYELITFQEIKAGLDYIGRHPVELILLDLEFTLANQSAIFSIDEINPRIPIIVVSHLSHYQRQLQLKTNVVGFVSKGYLEDQLVRSIFEVLCSKNIVKRPSSFVFPASNGSIGEEFNLSDILYIKIYVFSEYTIHKPDGTEIHKPSVSFSDLCKRIEESGATVLQPISRNTIINTNYISEVYVERNGRATITLLGCPEKFHVGKNYQGKFRNWYTE